LPESPITYDSHEWVGACYVDLDDAQAKYSDRRGSVRLKTETKVDVLEVMCSRCRRRFDEAVDEPCVRTHWLHGGPIGERAGRGGEEDADEFDESVAAVEA
jgi:hypothetical protein